MKKKRSRSRKGNKASASEAPNRKQLESDLGEATDTLECLYYLGQATEEANRTHIAKLRAAVKTLSVEPLTRLIEAVNVDLAALKAESDCLLSADEIRNLVRRMT